MKYQSRSIVRKNSKDTCNGTKEWQVNRARGEEKNIGLKTQNETELVPKVLLLCGKWVKRRQFNRDNRVFCTTK